MRRARIQIKPNIAKAAKQAPAPEAPAAESSEKSSEVAAPNVTPTTEDVVVTVNQNSSPDTSDDAPSESMKSLHVDISRSHQNHVHFTDDVVDNEHARKDVEGGHDISSALLSPSSQFATPNGPVRMMTPRSRNVSMCEDESILQPKQPRDKKRFSGKEELDTKTWKMSDLARWNPRNEQTNFRRERRSSTSSTIITKSEQGDFDSPTPRVNAPQVKIGADGRLVIDESSLLVQSAQINHESVWETVEEGRMGSKITSMSFRNRIFRKPNLWSERETDLFYEVLQCTGTDFGLMHHYLPQRSRPELKAKYNREEKHNWGRLLKAISHPTRLDGELEVRIAKVMAEIEDEIQEKKVVKEYEKEEERKVREQIRLQKATERAEEKIKKLQAKELIRQAKELEKDARNAQKLSDILSERAEKEARAREKSETRQLEKDAKAKERMDVKRLADEAKRCAVEAKKIINEKRKVEAQGRKEAKAQAESHNLEREAERIIRRLIQESQREERKQAHLANRRSPKKKNETASGDADGAATTSASAANASGDEIIDEITSESSESEESSDEDAVPAETARREKERMKEARIERKPRKTVTDHKPVYVNTMDIKYAQQPVNKSIEMVLMAKGNLFDSADEDMEVPEQADTPAPDDSAPGPAPPPAAPAEPEEEPVPQAVTDVIEEMGRCRSKTPVAVEQQEEREEEEGEPKRKKAKIQNETKESEAKKNLTDAPQGEANDDMDVDVNVVNNSDDDLYEEIIDVVAVSPEPHVRLSVRHQSPIPSTSSAPPPPASPEPAPSPSLSTSKSSSSESAPSESNAPPRNISLARRTVKKPVFWVKKK